MKKQEVRDALKRAYYNNMQMSGNDRYLHDAEQRMDEISLIYSDLFKVSVDVAKKELNTFKEIP